MKSAHFTDDITGSGRWRYLSKDAWLAHGYWELGLELKSVLLTGKVIGVEPWAQQHWESMEGGRSGCDHHVKSPVPLHESALKTVEEGAEPLQPFLTSNKLLLLFCSEWQWGVYISYSPGESQTPDSGSRACSSQCPPQPLYLAHGCWWVSVPWMNEWMLALTQRGRKENRSPGDVGLGVSQLSAWLEIWLRELEREGPVASGGTSGRTHTTVSTLLNFSMTPDSWLRRTEKLILSFFSLALITF